jgi:hypothetical protein
MVLPGSSGAVIVVGSDLTLPAARSPENCILSTPLCTRLPFAYHAGNAFAAKSPTKGQITSFGIKSGGSEAVTFRLGQFPGNGGGIGTGTGPTVALQAAGTFSVPAAMPVKVGDSIGLDAPATRTVTSLPGGCLNGAFYALFHPPLTNGVFQSGDSTNACELLVNAVIVPSNKFTFGKLRLNKGAGTATLIVKLPGPGKLSLSGKGVGRAKKKAKAAGKTKLRIRPVGAATGTVTLKVRVTFSPTGGSPNTEKRKVTLHL